MRTLYKIIKEVLHTAAFIAVVAALIKLAVWAKQGHFSAIIYRCKLWLFY